jgi:predicted dehydrogenase
VTVPSNSNTSHGSGVDRRRFLERSALQAAAGVAAGLSGWLPASAASADPIHIGVIGVRSRGLELATKLARMPGVNVVSLCDVDAGVLADAQRTLCNLQSSTPAVQSDYRALLDDPRLNAVVIATPDHWHAAMASEACLAGKDVYLESPATRELHEWRPLRDLATRTGRVIQTGLQQRSGAHVLSAIDLIQRGDIGRVRFARAWMACRRKSIGRRGDSSAPNGVDYANWLGPAPQRPFNGNRFHANWSRFWDYGSGELGLWGVHWLDVAGWALNVAGAVSVQSIGGPASSSDDQQTPETLTVHYQFERLHPVEIVWEHRTWTVHGNEGRTSGVAFYGEDGTLVLDRGGWKIYDRRDAQGENGSDLDRPHLQNFIDCVRTRQRPAAALENVELAESLCHLGVLSYRQGRPLTHEFASSSPPLRA